MNKVDELADELDEMITSMTNSGMWTSTTTTIATPNRGDGEQTAIAALQQIVDADMMDSSEYEKKYGTDADYDPYVIASKAMEKING